MTKILFSSVLILSVCFVFVSGQTRNRIARANNNSSPNCRVFLNGKLLNNPKPIYPNEAKVAGVAGKVEVAVEIDEAGNVIGVESTLGDDILAKAATEAALQAKFSPTLCDGKATKTIGIITYNFTPSELIREYFKPSRIEDYPDLASENGFYESVLFLTENYRISFGYADQKFHGEMFLTKGDFCHFLRQTLEMLDSRGKLANKIPSKIGLYQSYNPFKLKEIEFNPSSPFAESVKVLLQKYNIVLAGKEGIFEGDSILTNKEVIEIWQQIFDDEALPVNFLYSKDKVKEMTRGEFSIYLKESLDVLTYKILP